MTKRKHVEPAPGPLEDYAARFDDLLATRAQRQGFRRYLEVCCCPKSATRRLRLWQTQNRWSGPSARRPRVCNGSSRSRAGTPRR